MELCEHPNCPAAHVPQRLALWSMKHKELQLKLEEIFQGTPDEAARHTAICDLRAGYTRFDRGTQTIVSEIRPLEDLMTLMKRLKREVQETHHKTLAETQQYATIFKEKCKKLEIRIQEKMLSRLKALQEQHEEEIEIIRGACRQQLANELARISPEHYNIQFTVTKTMAKPTKDATELQQEVNELTNALEACHEELAENKVITKKIKQEHDELLDRFQMVRQINTAQTNVALEKQNIEAKKKFDELEKEKKELKKELDKCQMDNMTWIKELETLQAQLDFERSISSQLKRNMSLLEKDLEKSGFNHPLTSDHSPISPKTKLRAVVAKKQAGGRLYSLTRTLQAGTKAIKDSSSTSTISLSRQLSKHRGTSLQGVNYSKDNQKIQSGALNAKVMGELQMAKEPTSTQTNLVKNTPSNQRSVMKVRQKDERKSLQEIWLNKGMLVDANSDSIGNKQIRIRERSVLDKFAAEKETASNNATRHRPSTNTVSKNKNNKSRAKNKKQNKERSFGRGLGTPTGNINKSPRSSLQYDKTLKTVNTPTTHESCNDIEIENKVIRSLRKSLEEDYNNFQKDFSLITDNPTKKFQVYSLVDQSIHNPFVDAATDKKFPSDFTDAIKVGATSETTRDIAADTSNDKNAKLFEVNKERGIVGLSVKSGQPDLCQSIFQTETNVDGDEDPKEESVVRNVVSDTELLRSLFNLLDSNVDLTENVRDSIFRSDVDENLEDLTENVRDSISRSDVDENLEDLTKNVRDSMFRSDVDENLEDLTENVSDSLFRSDVDENLRSRVYEEIMVKSVSYETKYGEPSSGSKLTIKENSLSSEEPKSMSTKVERIKSSRITMESIPKKKELDNIGTHTKLNELDLHQTPIIRHNQVNTENNKMFTGSKKVDKPKAGIMPSISENNRDTSTPEDKRLTADAKVKIRETSTDAKLDNSKFQLTVLWSKKDQRSRVNKTVTDDAEVDNSKVTAAVDNKKVQKAIENKSLIPGAKFSNSNLQLTALGNTKDQRTRKNISMRADANIESSKLQLTAVRNKKYQIVLENERLTPDPKVDSSELQLTAVGNKKAQRTQDIKTVRADAKFDSSKLQLTAVGNKKDQRTRELIPVTADAKADNSKIRLTAVWNKKDQRTREDMSVTADAKVDNYSKVHLTGGKKYQECAGNNRFKADEKVDSSKSRLPAVDSKKAQSADSKVTSDAKVYGKLNPANKLLTSTKKSTERKFFANQLNRDNVTVANFVPASQLNPFKKPYLTPTFSNKPISTSDKFLTNQKEATSTDLITKSTPYPLVKDDVMKATPKTVKSKKSSMHQHTSFLTAPLPFCKMSTNCTHSRREQVSTGSLQSDLDSTSDKQEHQADVLPGSPKDLFLFSSDPIQSGNSGMSTQEKIPPSKAIQPRTAETNFQAVMPTLRSSNLVQLDTPDNTSKQLDSAKDLLYRLPSTSGKLASTLQRAHEYKCTDNRDHYTSREVRTKPAVLRSSTVSKGFHPAKSAPPNTPSSRTNLEKSRIVNTQERVRGVPTTIDVSVLEQPLYKNLKSVLFPALGLQFSLSHLKPEE